MTLDRLDGLLFFPATAFDALGRVDLEVYRHHLKTRIAAGPGAVFACCGTGEFFALDIDEYGQCVQVAVQEAAGRIPVVAGVGYNVGLAGRYARRAAEAGAAGLLVMPPPLAASGGQAGLREHYLRLADASPIDLIVYQRDGVAFAPETVADLAAHPRIVGFKDGRGDLDLMRRIVGAVRDRHGAGALMYFNGMPTAEMTALPYRSVGVADYSSAVFCFAPEIALAFHGAYRAGDPAMLDRLLDGFFRPYVELRRQGPGYAVSLVKAGVRLTGLDLGPVRPPLSDPTPEHLERLAALVATGRELAEAAR